MDRTLPTCIVVALLVALTAGCSNAEPDSNSMWSRLDPLISLSIDKTSVAPGGTIQASWTAPPGQSQWDWISMYAAGAPNTSYQEWYYTDGATSGTKSFTAPSTTGTFEIRYLLNGAYTLGATSTPFTVGDEPGCVGADCPITLSVDKTSVAPGGVIDLSWIAPAGQSVHDWVSIYAAGAPNTSYQEWYYTGGTTSGTKTFTAPATAGTYEFRYLLNNGYTVAATSTVVTVGTVTIECGDGTCGANETCTSCPADCGACSTDHPRFMITRNGLSPTVSELQARFAPGGAQNADFQSLVDIYCSKSTSSPAGVLDTFSDAQLGAYIYSFLILTYPVAGIDYRDCANLAGIQAKFFPIYDSIVGVSWTSHSVPAVCAAYDWAYDGLSASRRQNGRNFLKSVTGSTSDMSTVNPFSHSDTGARGRTAWVMAGYCFKGDNPADDAGSNGADARIAKYDEWVGTGSNSTRVARSFFAGDDGGYAEGMGYYFSETLQSYGYLEFVTADLHRTATGAASEFASGRHTDMEYAAQWMTYLMAPYQPQTSPGFPQYLTLKTAQTTESFSISDSYTSDADWTQNTASLLKNYARVFSASNPSQAGLASWLFKELYHDDGKVPMVVGSSLTDRWALLGNFLGYNTVAPKSPSELGLPIARHFDPYGLVVIRDGWSFDGNGTLVTFEAAPWQWTILDYGQCNPGGFTVHRDGPLVIDPGSGAHDPYHESCWSKNIVIFPKPTETRGGRPYWDKGGARPPHGFTQPTGVGNWQTPGSQWDIGGLKSGTGLVDLTDGTTAHDYSYVYADQTRAFNGTAVKDAENSAKVENNERQLVRFPPKTSTAPGFTVVFDRTRSTGTDVEQRWLLHPAGHTTVGQRTMTIASFDSSGTTTRAGAPSQHWLGTGGSIFGTISYSGVSQLSSKAFWTPLLPSALKIIERGGPNAAVQAYQADGHEHEDPYGVQNGTQAVDTPSSGSTSGQPYYPWEGQWRYELLPQTTSQTVNFLNVIEDVEPGQASRSPTQALAGTHTTGVRVNDQIVWFKTASGTLGAGASWLFSVSSSGSYRVLFTNLPPSSTISMSCGGNIGTPKMVSSGSTTISSNAQGVAYVLVPINATGSGAANACVLG